jgi:hypothetical protein
MCASISARFSGAPEIPTVGETLPGYQKPPSWWAFFGPAKLPAPTNQPAPRPVPPTVPAPVTPTEPPPASPPVRKPAEVASCDEVSCVLSNYEGACCAKIARRTAPAKDPDHLDRAAIEVGIQQVRPHVQACSERSSAKGVVKVQATVAPDGHVSSVTVQATPDPALGSCVAAAVKHATFASTQNGGSFVFPFVF